MALNNRYTLMTSKCSYMSLICICIFKNYWMLCEPCRLSIPSLLFLMFINTIDIHSGTHAQSLKSLAPDTLSWFHAVVLCCSAHLEGFSSNVCSSKETVSACFSPKHCLCIPFLPAQLVPFSLNYMQLGANSAYHFWQFLLKKLLLHEGR